MKTIRGYETFSVSRNTLAPVIFFGLPLKLFIIGAVAFICSVMLALVLGSFGVPLLFQVLISGTIGITSVGGVFVFYKKFGIKGFHFFQRNRNIYNEIVADKSIIRILKSKIQ